MTRIRMFFVVVIGLFMLGSCAKDDPITKIRIGDEFTIREGDTVDLTDTSKFIAKLSVQEITDSRCPEGSQCIRAGEAIVKLGLTGIREILVTQEMCIGDCPQFGNGFAQSDTATINVDNIYITLILTSVDPYPSDSNPQAEKSATIIFEDYTKVNP